MKQIFLNGLKKVTLRQIAEKLNVKSNKQNREKLNKSLMAFSYKTLIKVRNEIG